MHPALIAPADAGQSTPALGALVSRALRFDERMARTLGSGASVPPAGPPSVLRRRWQAHVADGDEAVFVRRLDRDGWTLGQVERALACTTTDSALPAWAIWLQAQLASPLEPQAGPGKAPAIGLWRAWTTRACADCVAHRSFLLSDGLAAWREQLAQTLACLSAGVVASARRAPSSQLGDGSTLTWPLLHAYPRWARQLAQTTRSALDAIISLQQRLARDSGARAAHFGAWAGSPPQRVEPVGADVHRAGQQVLRLCFAEGRTLYYKPRPMAAESGFQTLLAELGEYGLEACPPAIRVLDCGEYGYAEAVTPAADSDDPALLARRFQQSGALIALTWLLNARDLHQDNLIAGAHGPVLVDLETLLQPTWPAATGTFNLASARHQDSCLASGFCEFAQARPDGGRIDASALRGSALPSRLVWRDQGQGVLHPARVSDAAARLGHRWYRNGQPVAPAEYLDELLHGFRSTLLAVQDTAPQLLDPKGAIGALAQARVRVVLRPSQQYADLQALLASPALQRDGATAVLAIDGLNRGFSALRDRPAWWPLTGSERQQLEDGDIPVFEVRADAQGFDALGAPGLFAASGMETVRRRIAQLDVARIEAECRLLKQALSPATPCHHGAPPAQAAPPHLASLLDGCRTLREHILARAVRGDDGLIAWPGADSAAMPTSRGNGGDYYLYRGALGIAWFLVALQRHAPDPRGLSAVRATLANLQRVLDAPEAPRLLAAEGLGALHGIGSLVLGLLALHRLDPALDALALAARVAEQIRPERIDSEPLAELAGGLAGGLLAVSALAELGACAAGPETAERIVAAIRSRSDSQGIPLGYGQAIRCGAAHGLSGIAFALAKAGDRLARPDWRLLAERLCREEDRGFDHATGNWRQQRDREQPAVDALNAYCNGATGILLLRADAGLWQGNALEERGLAALAQAPCAAALHACCGWIGRAEALCELGRLLDRPALQESGRGMAAATLAGIGKTDAPLADGSPGLFRGDAGIGLGLLRVLHDPDLPSALLLGPAKAAPR